MGQGSVTSLRYHGKFFFLQVTDFWKTISELFENEKSLEQQLDKILNSGDGKSLKGEDIHFKVSWRHGYVF